MKLIPLTLMLAITVVAALAACPRNTFGDVLGV